MTHTQYVSCAYFVTCAILSVQAIQLLVVWWRWRREQDES